MLCYPFTIAYYSNIGFGFPCLGRFCNLWWILNTYRMNGSQLVRVGSPWVPRKIELVRSGAGGLRWIRCFCKSTIRNNNIKHIISMILTYIDICMFIFQVYHIYITITIYIVLNIQCIPDPCIHCKSSPDASCVSTQALACMRLTNPQLEATYPDDAEEHFQEVLCCYAMVDRCGCGLCHEKCAPWA